MWSRPLLLRPLPSAHNTTKLLVRCKRRDRNRLLDLARQLSAIKIVASKMLMRSPRTFQGALANVFHLLIPV